jgi:PBSX family phage terminase large subunit
MLFTPKQNRFWLGCSHRWNIKEGAVRSGKTYMDYFLIPKRIRECKGDGLIVILGNTQGTIARNVLDPMRAMWGDKFVGRPSNDNTVRLFGKRAYVLGADKVSQVSKIQGAGFEYAYGDEITTWQKSFFEMLKSRLDKPNSKFDGTCNPDNPNHWFKRFLDSDADILRQKYTIDDNPFLAPEFVANLKQEYSGTVYYQRFILGEWCAAEGAVYDLYDEKKHIVDHALEPLKEGCYISCDYGTQNPTVFLKWKQGTVTGTWYLVDEYYYSGRDEQRQRTDAEFSADLSYFIGADKLIKVIVDPSAASFIAQLKQDGYSVNSANNAVLDGIRYTACQLSIGRIKVYAKCKNTRAEFMSYVWDSKASDRGEDAPLKQNDHCMDALRYFVYTVLKKRSGLNTGITGGI